jgi:hypothetical protein
VHLASATDGPDGEHPQSVEFVEEDDEVKVGTLRNIADQCGAEDFAAWCRWRDGHG